jgi:hypothetical protein
MTGSTKTFKGRLGIIAAILALATSVAAQELGDYAGARETEHPDWFKESFLDFEEDIEEATANGKRVMLYFWQRGCPNARNSSSTTSPRKTSSTRLGRTSTSLPSTCGAAVTWSRWEDRATRKKSWRLPSR